MCRKMDAYAWCCTLGALLVVSANSATSAGMQQQPQQKQVACPAQCSCDASMKSAVCASSSLTSVPHGLPPGLLSLDLSGNQIAEIGDADFRNLTQLQNLDLSANDLVDISTSAFDGQSSLQRLVLHSNQLEADQLGFIQELSPNLQYLDLSGNHLGQLNGTMLSNLTKLRTLKLRDNYLQEFAVEAVSTLKHLAVLDLSGNQLTNFSLEMDTAGTKLPLDALETVNLARNRLSTIDAFSSLQLASLSQLDLTDNTLEVLQPHWFSNMPNLTYLSISENEVGDIPADVFLQCRSLQQLQAYGLHNLTYLNKDSFSGLHSLQMLNLSNASSLTFVHPQAFQALQALRELDLSGSGLSSLHQWTFQNLTSLQSVALYDIPWSCDCELKWLHAWLTTNETQGLFAQVDDIRCASPVAFHGASLFSVPLVNFSCSAPSIVEYTKVASFKIGSAGVLDCIVEGNPKPVVTWITPDKVKLKHHPAFVDLSVAQPGQPHFHRGHHWHQADVYMYELAHDSRIQVLQNGSLYVDYIKRTDGGLYVCLVENYLGNDTAVSQLRLNYLILKTVSSMSIWIGFSVAGIFFLIVIVVSASRYAAFVCSEKEREKRRSIREVLERMTEYKAAQIDKLSAYKTAKFDQFSAKIDQFSAFKTAKIDKIRTHKQMTVASTLQHMERLRELYSNQMNKIKENCSQQVEKVRENYTTQVGKFQNYRSHHIDKIRENYNSQLLKVREYGATHVEKLREQYKLQQQHVLKLMELLDVGNCMTVIEAECMRTESMIFDSSITFDLEAQPVHIGRGSISDSDADLYMTASSNSESSSVVGVHLDMEDETVQQSDDDIDDDSPVEKKKKKKIPQLPAPPQEEGVSSCDSSPIPIPRTKHKRLKRTGSKPLPKQVEPDVENTAGPSHSRSSQHKPRAEIILQAGGLLQANVPRTVSTTDTNSEDAASCYESAQQTRDNTPEATDGRFTPPPSPSLFEDCVETHSPTADTEEESTV